MLALGVATAHAQDAVRGSALYRALPGNPGVGSCISCHGEPINNRNSVLRGAGGGATISRTIAAVGAMGYLRQYLVDADLGDIAAYLASVAPAGPIDALPDLSPTADHFGAVLVGTQATERVVVVRNRQPRDDVSIGAVLSADVAQFPFATIAPWRCHRSRNAAFTSRSARWRRALPAPRSPSSKVAGRCCASAH